MAQKITNSFIDSRKKKGFFETADLQRIFLCIKKHNGTL